MRFAGTPTYKPFGLVFRVMMAPAPIIQPRAISTPGNTKLEAPSQHPSPIVIGAFAPGPAL